MGTGPFPGLKCGLGVLLTTYPFLVPQSWNSTAIKVEITYRFVALGNLNEDEDVNSIWGNIKQNIQTSAKESLGMHEWKQHKPWFDEQCLAFLDQRRRAKMQWVQDPCKSNVDNLNSGRRDVSRHFRNKKKEYLIAKIEESEANSKINNIRDLYRGINDFKKG